MADIYLQRIGADVLPNRWGTPVTFQTLACDLQGEGVAAIIQMPVDDTITAIGFGCASKNGTPVDDTWTAGIQGVTTGGLCDNTYLGGGSPASVTLPGASGNVSTYGTGTYHFLTLANSVALQAGTYYSLVVQKTGADDATNYLTFRNGMTSGDAGGAIPYTLTAAATATPSSAVWTRVASDPVGFALRSATRTYFFPLLTNRAAQSVGTTTEKGFTFTLPSGFGTGAAYGVRGVEIVNGAGLAAAGTFTVNLYSDPLGTPVIQQTTGELDSDVTASAAANRAMVILFPEDTLTALVPGTKYGIGFSMSAAGGWGISTATLPDANSRDAYPLGGLTYMTRTLASAYPPDNSDGAFAETTTTIVLAEIILAAFTAAASGGGAMVHRIP